MNANRKWNEAIHPQVWTFFARCHVLKLCNHLQWLPRDKYSETWACEASPHLINPHRWDSCNSRLLTPSVSSNHYNSTSLFPIGPMSYKEVWFLETCYILKLVMKVKSDGPQHVLGTRVMHLFCLKNLLQELECSFLKCSSSLSPFCVCRDGVWEWLLSRLTQAGECTWWSLHSPGFVILFTWGMCQVRY